ncbi:hypothetical protein [Actinomadura rugatobispora]|uniref:Uncharacterized protein n=1 Tax=Actinomadura rugatobispora TaxID=1994 RepID=A0ABW0ZNC7_9ACTN|nr:hypothetical protein GCM10010200_035910 [Actinomadura rugatobispora]
MGPDKAEHLAAWLTREASYLGRIENPARQEEFADRHALAFARSILGGAQ